MATLVHTGSQSSVAGGASLSISSASAAASNTLVLQIAWLNATNATATAPGAIAGWTLAYGPNCATNTPLGPLSCGYAVYYKTAAGGVETAVFNDPFGGPTSLYAHGLITEWSGMGALDSASSSATTQNNAAAGTTGVTIPNTGTLANANSTVFTGVSIACGAGTASAGIAFSGGSWTTEFSDQNTSTSVGALTGHKVVSSNSALNAVYAWNGDVSMACYQAAVVVFSDTGGGSGTAPVRSAPLPPLLASHALGPLGLAGFALKGPQIRDAIFNAIVSESGSAADSIVSSLTAVNVITESGSATDTLSPSYLFAQAVTFAGSANDALTALLIALNTLTESGSAADAVTQGGSTYNQSVTENGSAGDSASNLIVGLNVLTESGTAADSVSQGGSVYSQSVTESGSTGDSMVAALVAANALIEAANATDALANFNSIISAISETGSVADAAFVTSGGATSITEALSAADTIGQLATLLNSIAEVESANDSLLVNGNYQAFLAEAANAADTVITVAPFMVGGPRYIIKRLRARRWTVSCNTYALFEAKAPDESVKLTFDFSPDLPEGVTLVGTPTVTFTVESGSDANPSAIANGQALANEAATGIIVPVDAGLDGVNYRIHVMIATTDPQLILSLSGILPVRS